MKAIVPDWIDAQDVCVVAAIWALGLVAWYFWMESAPRTAKQWGWFLLCGLVLAPFIFSMSIAALFFAGMDQLRKFLERLDKGKAAERRERGERD